MKPARVVFAAVALSAIFVFGFVFASRLANRPIPEAKVFAACQTEIESRIPEAFVTLNRLPGSDDYLAPGHVEDGRLWLSSFVAQDVYGIERTFTCEVSKGGAVEVYLYTD